MAQPLAGRIGPRWPLTFAPLVVAAGFLLEPDAKALIAAADAGDVLK